MAELSPADHVSGYDKFAEKICEALRPMYVDGIGIRIVSEFGWIIGKVPAA